MNTKDMQTALQALGFDPGPIDGKPGSRTRAAVRAFQTKYELVADGIAGRQTKTALRQAMTPAKPGKPEPDKSAIDRPVPAPSGPVSSLAKPPPNVRALQLLSTSRQINTIWIHCAATIEGKDYTVADIRSWHKARGWSDIGYHYAVYRDGSIQLGRPVGQVGSHVAGHNTGSIGIVYVGGVAKDGKTPKDTRTPEQRSSLMWLTQLLVRKHSVKRVRGHNEVAAKACPSFTVAKDALGAII